MLVPFLELRNYTDSNSFVWAGLTFEPDAKDEIEAWLKEIKFMPADAQILTMRKIDGNVKGDDGRTDVLFTTTETQFSPLKRLLVDGLKWTSDFIDNYGSDYGFIPLVAALEE